MVQAAAPARLIEGGLPTERLVANVLVAKYADHVPLYRQAQGFARQGIELDRVLGDAEIEILAEGVRLDHVGEAAMGGADEREFHRHGTTTAERRHFTLLQGAQQL